MKFLFASDSFKGTLSSPKTAELLTQAAREIFPDCVCDSIEVADGGEGTTEAVLSAVKGTTIGVKRRTRAGMGRCQAGFCSPRTMEILARELETPIGKITKCGGDSRIIEGVNKDSFQEGNK